MDGLSADQFQGVHMNDILFEEDLLTLNILLYDLEIVDGNIISELWLMNCAEIRKYCATSEIQQQHMIPEQH